MRKVSGHTHAEGFHFISDIDINKHEPSEISKLAQYSGHKNMYFFTPFHQKGENAESKSQKKDPTSESAVKGQWLMKEYMTLESVKMLVNSKKALRYLPHASYAIGKLKPEIQSARMTTSRKKRVNPKNKNTSSHLFLLMALIRHRLEMSISE
ncbi:hypothetical protein WN944_006937 [Citrus x changshan-huyou]|uniref:NAC domain-containing protein n=1 Tax=Citrus x changshan-huyou TaxID=2935761 RepID=A0AAP0QTX9_9ROSI